MYFRGIYSKNRTIKIGVSEAAGRDVFETRRLRIYL